MSTAWMRSMACLGLVVAVMMLAMSPARAATTLFHFSASEGDEYYELQLAGRQDPGAIELRWPGLGHSVLQGHGRQLEFDRDRQRLVLRYTNPGDPSQPPSFRITVTGDSGVLEFEGRRIPGQASWEIL